MISLKSFGNGPALRGGSRTPQQFTEGCRQALARARTVAQKVHESAVETEHLLEALILAQDRKIVTVLDRLRIDRTELRRRLGNSRDVRDRSQRRPRQDDDLPFTREAKRALELAMREAREQGDAPVDAGHLLVGLLRVRRGPAARGLTDLGLTLQGVRDACADYDARRIDRAPWRFQVDDRSPRSIHEQIVDKVREAVATGDLEPGERLPPVRRMAEELGVAPGTVGRAYVDLERRSIVHTSRAHGTRISDRRRQGSPQERSAALVELLRPAIIAAFHLGATRAELEAALRVANSAIYDARKRGMDQAERITDM